MTDLKHPASLLSSIKQFILYYLNTYNYVYIRSMAFVRSPVIDLAVINDGTSPFFDTKQHIRNGDKRLNDLNNVCCYSDLLINFCSHFRDFVFQWILNNWIWMFINMPIRVFAFHSIVFNTTNLLSLCLLYCQELLFNFSESRCLFFMCSGLYSCSS